MNITAIGAGCAVGYLFRHAGADVHPLLALDALQNKLADAQHAYQRRQGLGYLIRRAVARRHNVGGVALGVVRAADAAYRHVRRVAAVHALQTPGTSYAEPASEQAAKRYSVPMIRYFQNHRFLEFGVNSRCRPSASLSRTRFASAEQTTVLHCTSVSMSYPGKQHFGGTVA